MLNEYAHLLKEQGNYVITVEGIDWYEYGEFMVPAYLPHCCPDISYRVAQQVLRISKRPFVRWDSRYGQLPSSQWWYVLKRGPWALDSIKDKKKRWMIRQGRKSFHVRILRFDEVVAKCTKVAQLATERYKGEALVETPEVLQKRVEAMLKVPGVLEYMGCFDKDTLVSFSENYIQNNAVWLANIRHDPAFLSKYSSYALIDGILDYYVNVKNVDYVLDGSRSIYHRTEFQNHLIRVFGFTKECAILNIVYSNMFKTMVNMTYPFRSIIWFLRDKWANDFLGKVGAVLKQECIRKDCMRL